MLILKTAAKIHILSFMKDIIDIILSSIEDKYTKGFYWEDFSKPKMLWKRVGSILRFCYNDNETLGLDSTCFATGENIEFICCVLNSPMGHYLLKDAPKTGTGDLLVSVQAIEPIQLPQVGSETNSEFKKLLERLIKTDTPSNEKEISCKVFKLYDLSLDEQSYIETNFT